jgi:hypothetical protein
MSRPDWVGEPPDNTFELRRLPGCEGPTSIKLAARAQLRSTSIKLDGRAYIVLGRSGETDVKLEGKLCSRKHAAVGFDPAKGHVYLMDLGSAHA